MSFEEFLRELLQWDRGQGSVLDSQVRPRWSYQMDKIQKYFILGLKVLIIASKSLYN